MHRDRTDAFHYVGGTSQLGLAPVRRGREDERDPRRPVGGELPEQAVDFLDRKNAVPWLVIGREADGEYRLDPSAVLRREAQSLPGGRGQLEARSGIALQHTRAIETHDPARRGPFLGVKA